MKNTENLSLRNFFSSDFLVIKNICKTRRNKQFFGFFFEIRLIKYSNSCGMRESKSTTTWPVTQWKNASLWLLQYGPNFKRWAISFQYWNIYSKSEMFNSRIYLYPNSLQRAWVFIKKIYISYLFLLAWAME